MEKYISVTCSKEHIVRSSSAQQSIDIKRYDSIYPLTNFNKRQQKLLIINDPPTEGLKKHLHFE